MIELSCLDKFLIKKDFININKGIWLHKDYIPFFERLNIKKFEDFINLKGEVVKRNKYREIIKFKIHKKFPFFYIKKHISPSQKEYIKELITLKNPLSSAKQEIINIFYLNELNINTLIPIGFGEKNKTLFREPQSFIITEEIKGIKLERFFENTPKIFKKDFIFRNKLIEELARIINKLHTNNIHHQDFYFGHIYIEFNEGDNNSKDFRLHLIDLQRMRKKKYLLERWKIKDIAQLNYSSLFYKDISNIDRIKFLKKYFKIDKLGILQRIWIKMIKIRNKKTLKHETKKKLKKFKKGGKDGKQF